MKLPKGSLVGFVRDAIRSCGRDGTTSYHIATIVRSVIPPEVAIQAYVRALMTHRRHRPPSFTRRPKSMEQQVISGCLAIVSSTLSGSPKMFLRTGRGKNAIWRVAEDPAAQVPPPRPRRHLSTHQQIEALIRRGWTVRQIKTELHVSANTVTYVRRTMQQSEGPKSVTRGAA